MVDYKLKQAVLNFDTTTSILKIQNQYSMYVYDKNTFKTLPYGLCEDYITTVADYYSTNYPEYWEEAEKINNAFYERTRRLRAKLTWMMENFQCSFLTFNFNDVALSLDPKYRRSLISRTCNELDCYYVGNVDFGSDDVYIDRHGNERMGTSREHYHVVVSVPCDTRYSEALRSFTKDYGYVYVEPCYMPSGSGKPLAKYVSKLCNHAVKESASRSSLLYSRNHRIPDVPLIKDPKITRSMIAPLPMEYLVECEDENPFVFYVQESFL